MRWQVRLRVEGPLLVGRGAATQNVQLGRDYIPGSVWRGAVAEAVLRAADALAPGNAHGQAAELPSEFGSVFGPETRFGFLYPVPGEGWDGFPLPLTVHSCKARPGFAGGAGDRAKGNGGHGVVDLLPVRLRRHVGLAEELPSGCRVCAERLDRYRGLGARKLAAPGQANAYKAVKVRRQLLVRVGLDRRTETAADGVLYALDAQVPGRDGALYFTGSWCGTPQAREALERLLDSACPRINSGWEVRVGTARARGLGRAVLEITKAATEKQPVLPPLEARLEAFQPRREDGQLAAPDHLYFALLLRAPLLVRDAGGVACGRPDARVLAQYVTCLPDKLEFLETLSVLEWESWDGWAMAWGLPKPVQAALAPGSVLVYRAPAGERRAVLTFLEEVENAGLGERTTEGWGEVVACDPLHLECDRGRRRCRREVGTAGGQCLERRSGGAGGGNRTGTGTGRQ